MKADVEPLPLVPVICMTLSLSRSLSWEPRSINVCETQHEDRTHAVTNPVKILEHLRDSEVAQSAAGRTKSLKSGCITLERVERVDCFAVGPGRHGFEGQGEGTEEMGKWE